VLDYAANGMAFWSVEDIRRRYEATCVERNVDSNKRLTDFFATEAGPEDFYQHVKTNLEAAEFG
jgi:hypothetical protein